MKIGIVVQCFPVPSETFIVTKVLGLLDKGYDVHIFANKNSSYWKNFKILKERKDIKDRIKLSVFAYRRNKSMFVTKVISQVLFKAIVHPIQVGKLIAHIISKRKVIRVSVLQQFFYKMMFVGEKIDVLHIEFDFQAYGIADLKDYLGCKLVLSGRGSIKRTSVLNTYPEFYDVVLPFVDHYHFISKYLYIEACKAGLKEIVPISLIEPAIDLKLFAPKGKEQNEEIILITTARLSWAKGYEFAIDAVARVAKEIPSIKYIIIGEGDYKEAIRFAAEQYGLVSNGVVQFAGQISRENVHNLLQNADIMIHAALEEGFCNAVIEAQAMELPVVCSDAGGLPENVEDGVTGFVVPRRDSRAMADRIIQLARDPELRVSMGNNGRQRAIRRFNIDDQITKFDNMYKLICP